MKILSTSEYVSWRATKQPEGKIVIQETTEEGKTTTKELPVAEEPNFNQWLLVDETDSQIKGYLHLKTNNRVAVMLSMIWVDPTKRKQGYGRRFMRIAREFAREKKLFLVSNYCNVPLFLERHGMKKGLPDTVKKLANKFVKIMGGEKSIMMEVATECLEEVFPDVGKYTLAPVIPFLSCSN